ncbi:ImmA/IrrE family metallo-endopeptidase [Mesobacillus subterraneus]|uniref:ImmA/IrrE family metallo-endopeptidase n=1 Tax=Mesobacillus subterraneus TaxID=285983 RepID=UPI00203FC9E2|nr:ImmA/IrrE family metallo-endopeptidase [Mesobacillus subterraneus]MCM3663488.1 ImmA/IrrE family metallo-endopeptidase [Mesobacillus subterraneus]MCM3683258.1 ImmA/IrrE family metallo-endopeptidase [Mesobacillus subterraneus]
MNYNTTLLEDWIENFYINLGIFHPHQIDLHSIAYRLGYSVTYRNISSRFYETEIIIDERISPQEQWQEFAHELCHAERHAGNQLVMPKSFLELQEFQANLFAYHFCVPTFMLLRLQLPENTKQAIYFISNTFFVTLEFAEYRLNLYWNRINSSTLVAEKNYKEMI